MTVGAATDDPGLQKERRTLGHTLVATALAQARDEIPRGAAPIGQAETVFPSLFEITERLEALARHRWGASRGGPGPSPWERGLASVGLGDVGRIRRALRAMGWHA